MHGSFHFSTCNRSGNIGPTQEEADQYYNNTNVNVKIFSGIQKWIVPITGTYIIEAAGASGLSACQGSIGGKGAVVSQTVRLKASEILYILVGQQGSIPSDHWGGTGGGASFVVKNDTLSSDLLIPANAFVSPILIAAGGGGSGDCNSGATILQGAPGSCEIVEESPATNIEAAASGGGGYHFNSTNNATKSFLQGSEASISSPGDSGNSVGAFGGGGHSYNAGGGGGGFKGGNSNSHGYAANGGHSFYSRINLVKCIEGQNEGSGYVLITLHFPHCTRFLKSSFHLFHLIYFFTTHYNHKN